MTQKWNLQDIRPAQPRKERSVQRGESPQRKRPIPQKERESREDLEDSSNITIIDGNKKKRKTLLYALTIFFVVVGGGVIASILTGGADITVYPRYREPNVNAVFQAFRTPQPKELAFEIMTLEAEGERQVAATGKEEVTTQANGTILIYNSHQSKPVRLVTNTRFEANGLIFRIKDSAVVPGYTKDENGKILPGVITADVFADEVGEEYNLPPSKFTIPGFKGDPEYETIYAESIETFTGGFNGNRFIIDDSELQTAKQALQMELRNSLLERISSEKPAGLVLFDDSVTFTYQTLPSVEYGEDLATIKEKVTMRIPLFKADEFASFIAEATVPGYEGDPVRITDYDVLKFAYTTATTSSSDISSSENISFKLAGRPQIVWEYDAEKLKTDLLNKNKTALPAVLGAYPAIEKAEAVIRPFWKTKFPIKMDEINIIEVVE
jgi:hypothetical protein